MFKLEYTINNLDEDTFIDMDLIYEDQNFSIKFSPENPTKILIEEQGTFDSGPSNGEFKLYWDKEYFTFCVGKYGDGNGGSMIVKIKNTPELYLSFTNAINEWNTHVHK